jgi:vancomycin resistance protein YoaR
MAATQRSLPLAPAPGFDTVVLWLGRFAYTSVCVGVIFCSLALAGAAVFELNYQGRIYPGVQAWGVDLSGMTIKEATFALATTFAYPLSPAFTFHDGDQTWTATPSELGLSYNLAGTVANAYGLGRSGDVWADAEVQFTTWYAGRQVAPVIIYDESRNQAYLREWAQKLSRPTLEASLKAEGVKVTVTPGQVGRELDTTALAKALQPALLALGKADLPLTFVETPPLVLDASAQATAAEAILREPLTLIISPTTLITGTMPAGPWTIDPATLASMLAVKRVADGVTAAHFEVDLDPAALKTFLESVAPTLEQKAQNARFTFNDDTRQLEVVAPSRDDRHLDIDATIEQVTQALKQGVHTVPLAFVVAPPAVPDTATADQLGIKELVSEQSTYFKGSGAERINNIKVAAARFHGLLVPPNAVFSFDDNLGDVSLDSGFAEALIIYGGRTIRGVGGGVCQVSTTVLRAAYFGGYPIVERSWHAYRVGYYERGDPGQWQGPGLDATVYAPLVDFKFKNDSPTWLLMEVYVNPAAARITWKFYSTSDGRQVAVKPAVIENVVPAPEPLYEEDPALAKGEIKQVDYQADGADVTVTRIITRNGERVNPQEAPMATHYQPWRAVFHYGPGTDNIPTPTPAETPTPTNP